MGFFLKKFFRILCMRIFFITFFSLYALIHVYFFIKLKSAFNLSILIQVTIILFLLLMVFSPVIIRISEKEGLETFAILLSWIGYLWMAFIFLFLFFGLITDFGRFSIFLISKVMGRDLSLFSFLGLKKFHFIFPLVCAFLFVFYGYFEARNIKIEKITIESDKIINNLRIVQISDVHIGLIIRKDRVRNIVEKIKILDPDIVVSTGDLVDGQIDRLNSIAEILKELQPPFGKYAITGNHEFYAGINQALSFIEKSGFKILRNEGVYIENFNVNIVGVDDLESIRFGFNPKISEVELLKNFQNGGYLILLKHRPLINEQSRSLFDLQLSGHTHKGQLFPFSIITALYYPKQAGCLRDINGCYLYTSRGTGTWGPPVRIFAPPEITVIDIIRKF